MFTISLFTLKKILYQYTGNIGSSQIYEPKKYVLGLEITLFESKSIVLINNLTREIFIRCRFYVAL